MKAVRYSQEEDALVGTLSAFCLWGRAAMRQGAVGPDIWNMPWRWAQHC